MLHLGHVFGRGDQEQNRVEVALLRNDVIFTQEVGQNRRRNTEVGVLAGFGIDTRSRQQELTRVDEVLAFLISLEACHF